MGFNEKANKASSFKSDIFKEGVSYKTMSGGKDGSAIVFKLLPAFNPEDIVQDEQNNQYINPIGYIPFRTPEGDLSDWGNIVQIVKFVGHGTFKDGTRRNFVLLSNFAENEDENVYDPYIELRKVAAGNEEWKYLTVDVKEGNKRISNAVLPRPMRLLIANIIDMAMTDKVMVGLFSTSACNALISPSNGLACQRASNVTEEQVQANYLCEWAVGDLTCPKNGPLLVCSRATDRGEMSGYDITLALDIQKRVRRWAVNPPELLAYRYDINNLSDVLVKEDPETVVKGLVSVLNQRSPSGAHEYGLLKEVFGPVYGNIIPEPPASRGVAAGFGENPANVTPPKIKPQGKFSNAAATMDADEDSAPEASNTTEVADVPQSEPVPAPTPPSVQEELETPPPAASNTKPIPPGIPGMPVGSFDREAFLKRLKK